MRPECIYCGRILSELDERGASLKCEGSPINKHARYSVSLSLIKDVGEGGEYAKDLSHESYQQMGRDRHPVGQHETTNGTGL